MVVNLSGNIESKMHSYYNFVNIQVLEQWHQYSMYSYAKMRAKFITIILIQLYGNNTTLS